VARAHRAGLDHADLNAHNLMFDQRGRGWVIDLDRGRLRIPDTRWRERNLQRLRRSLLKLRGERSTEQVLADYARLRRAYDGAWERGCSWTIRPTAGTCNCTASATPTPW